MHGTFVHSILATGCWILLAGSSHADGFLLGKKGQYIPEREQAAFIEWNGGVQTLFLAVRADKADSGSLWIVPVPAEPGEVQAEPTLEFPHVVRFQDRLDRVPRDLKETARFAFEASTGLVARRMFDGSTGGTVFADVGNVLGGSSPGVTVHQHTENHGMVVEVLTATSPAALNAYLRSKGVSSTAEQLQGLASYLGKSFTLICAWRAEERSTARAVRIRFPSDRIYYPMLPTRVYGHEVATSIFVRGWVKPGPKQAGQGVLECRCGLGDVTTKSISDGPFNVTSSDFDLGMGSFGGVGLTRVRVPSDPRLWQTDLELDPPSTWPGRMTNLLLARDGTHAYVLVIAFALLAGIGFMTWFKPAAQRTWQDWLIAILLGLSLLLTIYAMVLAAFLLLVPNKSEKKLRIFLAVMLLWVGFIIGSILHIGIGQIPPTDAEIEAAHCAMPSPLPEGGYEIPVLSRLTELGYFISGVSLAMLLSATALCLNLLGRRAAIGLLGMAAFHALACFAVLTLLAEWIGPYVSG